MVNEVAYPKDTPSFDLSISLRQVTGKRIFGEMIVAADEPAAFDSREVMLLTWLASLSLFDLEAGEAALIAMEPAYRTPPCRAPPLRSCRRRCAPSRGANRT